MKSLKRSIQIAVPQDFLFEFSQRESGRLGWDFRMIDFRIHDGVDLPRKGDLMTFVTKGGVSMTNVYVHIRRPDCISIKMIAGPWFLKSFGGAWRFEKITSEITRVTFNYSFTLRDDIRWANALGRMIYFEDLVTRQRALRKGAEQAYRQFEERGYLPLQAAHPA